jgi:hypothetical protein
MRPAIRRNRRSILLPDPRVRLLGVVRVSVKIEVSRLADHFVAEIGEMATWRCFAGGIRRVILCYFALGQFAVFDIGVWGFRRFGFGYLEGLGLF